MNVVRFRDLGFGGLVEVWNPVFVKVDQIIGGRGSVSGVLL